MRINPRLFLILVTLILAILAISFYLNTFQHLFGTHIDHPKQVQVIFISVDWKRDTPDKLES